MEVQSRARVLSQVSRSRQVEPRRLDLLFRTGICFRQSAFEYACLVKEHSAYLDLLDLGTAHLDSAAWAMGTFTFFVAEGLAILFQAWSCMESSAQAWAATPQL